ncbi:MAG: hypothetical protein U1B80_10740, partial [Anaerolineaceae bacterium]|nr:hypothetical protein [Anaerolineaceae bacterium]
MTAPLLWIGVPLIGATVLLLISRRPMLAAIFAFGFSLTLALLAWRLPIDQAVRLGPFTLELGTTLMIFGRRFVLDNSDRPILVLL